MRTRADVVILPAVKSSVTRNSSEDVRTGREDLNEPAVGAASDKFHCRKTFQWPSWRREYLLLPRNSALRTRLPAAFRIVPRQPT